MKLESYLKSIDYNLREIWKRVGGYYKSPEEFEKEIKQKSTTFSKDCYDAMKKPHLDEIRNTKNSKKV